MRRVRLLVLSMVVWSLGVHSAAKPPAAQEAKVARVGLISNDAPGATFDLLRDSFAKFGYAEGRNIVIEARFARGQLDRAPQLTAELVGLNVDVVVALGAVGVHGRRQASTTIPIVFVGSLDPVATGFAATLERPGGSATGIVSFDPQQATKQLQILKELVPGLTRVAILSDQDVPRVDGWSSLERANDTAARALGVQPQILRIKAQRQISRVRSLR